MTLEVLWGTRSLKKHSSITEMVDQNRFVLDVLDQEMGLAVNIIEIHSVKYIVLNNAPIVLPTLLIQSKEIRQYNERNEPKRLIIGKQLMRQITGTMDTEYDKNIAKWIFCINMSNSEMINIGVDPREIISKAAKNLAIIDECENSVLAAQDTVRHRLKQQIEKIESEVEKAHAKLSNRRQSWNQATIVECEDDIEGRLSYKSKLEECISNPESSSFKMRVVRTATSITEEHRIKRRRLGQGRPETIDDDEEEFVARCIEPKATYHGRRKETTVFLNRRVRRKDLLRIVNKKREEKGKSTNQSVTSVWNRSKPRRIDTIQAFRHKGKGLWAGGAKPSKS